MNRFYVNRHEPHEGHEPREGDEPCGGERNEPLQFLNVIKKANWVVFSLYF